MRQGKTETPQGLLMMFLPDSIVEQQILKSTASSEMHDLVSKLVRPSFISRQVYVATSDDATLLWSFI